MERSQPADGTVTRRVKQSAVHLKRVTTESGRPLASHVEVDVQEGGDSAFEVRCYLEAWARDAHKLRAKDIRAADHLVSATNTHRGPYLPVKEMGVHDGNIEIAFDQIVQAVTGQQPYDNLHVNEDAWVWVASEP
jgi:hypothetical protein